MTWQFFIGIFIVLGTISYLVRRNLAQVLAKYNLVINAFFFVCVLYPIGLVVGLSTQPNLAIGWPNLIYIAVCSVMFPIIMLTSFRASKDVDAGLYTILNNLTPIITISIASLLLSQTLNNQQMFGAAIILVSTFLATATQLNRRGKSSKAGISLALLSVTILGFAIVYESWMLTRIDYGAYLVYGWGAQTMWAALFAWPKRSQIKYLRRSKHRLLIITYAFTNAFKGLCFVAALKLSENASLVGASASFLAISVVIAAYFVLKEKDMLWLKISAAVLGAIGLSILNFG